MHTALLEQRANKWHTHPITKTGATIACGLPLNYLSQNHVVDLIPHLVVDLTLPLGR